jgi:hypothetical protein
MRSRPPFGRSSRLAVPELPPPLPPEVRTVGQLIGETIRAYGNNFWRVLPLGLPLGAVDQARVHESILATSLIYWAATPLIVAAYVRGCQIVLGGRVSRSTILVATLVYLPFPALDAIYILPGIAWFALVGLAVPAALVERLDVRAALRRGRQLGTADYIHSLGSLAAVVVVVGIAEITLGALLHTQSGASARVALFLADLVLTPMLYVGGAMLYTDQAARVRSPRPDGRRRDADLHPPLDSDTAGGADPQGQS